jgi:hypothetical protein
MLSKPNGRRVELVQRHKRRTDHGVQAQRSSAASSLPAITSGSDARRGFAG